MKEIFLSQGKSAIVDDDMYALLNIYKWSLTHQGYAERKIRVVLEDGTVVYKSLLMHRCINNTPPGVFTDHKNMNRLDNRKSNLRSATYSQNGVNRGIMVTNTSGFRGVSFDKRSRKYAAYIMKNNHKIHLGYYVDPAEAAIAYDKACVQIFGEFALTNAEIGQMDKFYYTDSLRDEVLMKKIELKEFGYVLHEIGLSQQDLNNIPDTETLGSAQNSFSISPEIAMYRKMIFKELMKIIRTALTPHQIKVLMLFIDGYTQIEIAQIVKCGQSAVHKSLRGNHDYSGGNRGDKVYGGSLKKIKKFASKNSRIQFALGEIKKLKSVVPAEDPKPWNIDEILANRKDGENNE